MNRQIKAKRGFTLVETVIVIAIIMILSSVSIIAISRFIQLGVDAEDEVDQQYESLSEYAGSANARFASVGFF